VPGSQNSASAALNACRRTIARDDLKEAGVFTRPGEKPGVNQCPVCATGKSSTVYRSKRDHHKCCLQSQPNPPSMPVLGFAAKPDFGRWPATSGIKAPGSDCSRLTADAGYRAVHARVHRCPQRFDP
jgi:hypothetical protein